MAESSEAIPDTRAASENMPLEDMLTVILVTSPIKSHPSTEMIEMVLTSYVAGANLAACPKIIVSDGAVGTVEGQKERQKQGRVPTDWLQPYEEFRRRLDDLIDEAAASPDPPLPFFLQGEQYQRQQQQQQQQEQHQRQQQHQRQHQQQQQQQHRTGLAGDDDNSNSNSNSTSNNSSNSNNPNCEDSNDHDNDQINDTDCDAAGDPEKKLNTNSNNNNSNNNNNIDDDEAGGAESDINNNNNSNSNSNNNNINDDEAGGAESDININNNESYGENNDEKVKFLDEEAGKNGKDSDGEDFQNLGTLEASTGSAQLFRIDRREDAEADASTSPTIDEASGLGGRGVEGSRVKGSNAEGSKVCSSSLSSSYPPRKLGSYEEAAAPTLALAFEDRVAEEVLDADAASVAAKHEGQEPKSADAPYDTANREGQELGGTHAPGKQAGGEPATTDFSSKHEGKRPTSDTRPRTPEATLEQEENKDKDPTWPRQRWASRPIEQENEEKQEEKQAGKQEKQQEDQSPTRPRQSWAFRHCRHLRMAGHAGFGGCTLGALRRTTTPYVLVLQHDRPLLQPFDASRILRAMSKSGGEVRYVGLPTKASLARVHPEHVQKRCRIPVRDQVENEEENDGWRKCCEQEGIALSRLLFWYDSSHFCSTEFYLNFVFGAGRVARNGFPEDSLGQEMHREISAGARDGSWREVHRRYGTYLLVGIREDADPTIPAASPMVGHMRGRRYVDDESAERQGWSRLPIQPVGAPGGGAGD